MGSEIELVRLKKSEKDFGFRVPGFGFQVSGFGFWVPGSGFRFSGSRFRVSGSGFRVQASRSRCRLPGSNLVPESRVQGPGSYFLVSGLC